MLPVGWRSSSAPSGPLEGASGRRRDRRRVNAAGLNLPPRESAALGKVENIFLREFLSSSQETSLSRARELANRSLGHKEAVRSYFLMRGAAAPALRWLPVPCPLLSPPFPVTHRVRRQRRCPGAGLRWQSRGVSPWLTHHHRKSR